MNPIYLIAGVITASILGFGQPRIKINDIEIKSGETTEVKIVLNPHDNTGAEGYVFDKNGLPIADAWVTFHCKDPEGPDRIDIWTDKNGYYRLTGMSAGRYEVVITGEKIKLAVPVFVEIKKNMLVRLDLHSKF